MSSSAAPPEPHVVEDFAGVLQLMSDGTVRRSAEPSALFRRVDIPEDDLGVEWKDVTWDPEHDLNARLYRPRRHLELSARIPMIPVVAYFHGGGFCIGSGRWPNYHAWCLRLAAELPAVVLSFDYRLAPEHRLPAAQDDGARAMSWLLSSATTTDPLLTNNNTAADFSRVFVAGDSAGGNIAHHVAVKMGVRNIRGAVLLAPAMAGEARTRAELECPSDAFLTTEMADRFRRLALPEGATRDDPVINPAGPRAPSLERVPMAPVLVVAGGRDVLRDRNEHYARRMEEEWGKEVEYVEIHGADHGFFQVEPWSERADEVVRVVRRFVVKHMEDKEYDGWRGEQLDLAVVDQ